jgi:hypothetical protein
MRLNLERCGGVFALGRFDCCALKGHRVTVCTKHRSLCYHVAFATAGHHVALIEQLKDSYSLCHIGSTKKQSWTKESCRTTRHDRGSVGPTRTPGLQANQAGQAGRDPRPAWLACVAFTYTYYSIDSCHRRYRSGHGCSLFFILVSIL